MKYLRVFVATAVLGHALAMATPADAARSRCLDEQPNVTLYSDQGASVYRLYCAYFLRLPDQGGFYYWRTAPLALRQISDFFAQSPEFQATYGTLTDTEFTELVYGNVFDRAPDAGGYAYWLDQLDSGLSRGEMMVLFSDSPEHRSKIATPLHGPDPHNPGTWDIQADLSEIQIAFDEAQNDAQTHGTYVGIASLAALSFAPITTEDLAACLGFDLNTAGVINSLEWSNLAPNPSWVHPALKVFPAGAGYRVYTADLSVTYQDDLTPPEVFSAVDVHIAVHPAAGPAFFPNC